MDWTALSLSLKLAAFTSLLLVPLAIALARWLAYGHARGRSIVEALVLMPLVLPPTVLGFYLMVAFAPQSPLGSALMRITGEPVVFSFSGILLASVLVNLPFAVQPIARAFEAIPQSVREAGLMSGLSRLDTFKRIELPLAWPGIVTALALVFAHTLGEFGVVLMMGGNIPGQTRTLAVSVYDSVQAFHMQDAAIMAATLVVIASVTIALVLAVSRRGGSFDISGRRQA